jgi:hypothetical protein
MTSEKLETIIRQWKNNCIEILEHVGRPDIYDSVLTKEIPRLIADIKSHEFQIKREVIEKVLAIVDERLSAGLDDMEAADYKEFLQAEFFVVAMGIVKDEIMKLKEQQP